MVEFVFLDVDAGLRELLGFLERADAEESLTLADGDAAAVGAVGEFREIQRLAESVGAVSGSGAGFANIRVSDNSDDAEEDNGGGISRNNDKIELGQMKYVGLRFQSASIPQGATITTAYIEFKAADANTESTDITIWGEDTDDASQFGTGNNDISNRTKTSASILWNNVENWSDNQTYNTPDISAVIQEIVNRGGWSSGNDIAVILESTDLNGKRLFDARDFSSADAGLLHVEF